MLCAAIAAMPAAAQQAECDKAPSLHPAIVNFRIDNDFLGGQDQGYTSGLMLMLVSPNLADYTDDPCLPGMARALNRYLAWLYPQGFEQQNMVFTLGQGLFTPTDAARTDLITDDRPYAGVLRVGLGYNARSGEHLRSTHLRLGLVGPSARGKEVQNAMHHVFGSERFEGWQNQLHDEVVFQVVHERLRRWPELKANRQSGWGADTIAHWGGSLGTLATYANAGAEWRYGWHLPDDFGSSPLRPAGENTAPSAYARENGGWTGHVFTTFDARWVLRDISLDGNTFRHSHSVDKRNFVADVGYGFVVQRGAWRVALARYHRTREFEGQRKLPVFGSLTVSRGF